MKIVLPLLLVSVILVAAGVSFRDDIYAFAAPYLTAAAPGGASAPAAGAAAPKRPATRVQTAVAERRQLAVNRQTIGSIVSPQSVSVTSDSAGLVVSINAKDGAMVQGGDVLVQLDPRMADAAVAKDQATILRDQATVESARLNLSRQSQLVSQNVVNQQVKDDAETTLKTAEATLQLDQAVLQSDLVTQGNRVIRAPFAGRLGQIAVSPGAYIAAGGQIVSLQSMSPLQASFSLPEADLGTIRAGMAAGKIVVSVTPAGTDAKPHTGTLSFVDNQVDPVSGTFKAYVTLDNKDMTLWPGQSAAVSVRLKTLDVVSVPAVAVQPAQGGSIVYVVTPEKTIAVHQVVVAATEGNTVGLSSGIAEGDHVVVEGQINLRNGTPVTETDDKPKATDSGKAAKPEKVQ